MNRFQRVIVLSASFLFLALNVSADNEDESSSAVLESQLLVDNEKITDEDVAAFQKAKKQPPASGGVKVEKVDSKDSFKKVPKNKAFDTEEAGEEE